MPVHRASKTFFYHIPKCAGSSIEEQFGMRTIENLFLPEFDTVRYDGVRFSLQHLTPAAVDALYPEFSDFESFTLTRHPYAKCVSAYFWLRTKLERKRFLFGFSEKDFQTWCHNVATLHDIDHTLHQHHWCRGTDHVLDISQYDELIRMFESRMPRKEGPVVHGKRNPFDTKKVLEGLSQTSLDLIYTLYEADFDLLKYPRRHA